MKAKKLKILLGTLLCMGVLLATSCAAADSGTEGNYVKIVLLQGNGEGGEHEITFNLPAPSSSGIYAKHTSSASDANADRYSVSRGGAETCTVSIPLRNMHTPVEVIDLDDVRLTADLIAAYIKEVQ